MFISDSCSKDPTLFLDVNAEPICPKIVEPEEEQDDFESRKLWCHVAQAIKERDYGKAQEAKSAVEETQRRLARLRSEDGISWHPKYFSPQPDGFWSFVDQHMLDESTETLKAHLEALIKRHDFDFRRRIELAEQLPK
jgi:hypothetical protein